MARYYGPNNKIFVFGTAAADESGRLVLSESAKVRAYRTAQAYFESSFNRESGQILITGGYGRGLVDSPPMEREARLLGKFLLEQFPRIPARAVLYECESTNTWENYINSLEQYPEFFEDIIDGKRRLGLVSHPYHLKRVIKIGKEVLGRAETDDSWYKPLATLRMDNEQSEKAAMAKADLQIAERRIAA